MEIQVDIGISIFPVRLFSSRTLKDLCTAAARSYFFSFMPLIKLISSFGSDH
jgi:hypothetical protein